MDKNFIQHQVSSFKDLVELLEYNFISENNSYKLIDLVKNQILVMGKSKMPYLSDLLSEKSGGNSSWFRMNISPEYADILYNADNHEVVYKNFVSLYNTYILTVGDSKVINFGSSSDLSFTSWSSGGASFGIDTQNISYIYNQNFNNSIEDKNLNLSQQNIDRYNGISNVFANRISFNESSIDKGKGFVYFNEQLKSVILNQYGIKGIVPLASNFSFRPDDSGKQIQLSISDYYNDSYDTSRYLSELTDTTLLAYNVNLFNDLLKLRESVKLKSNSESGNTYIDKINKENLINNNYKFYALASLKDKNSSYIKTAVNIVFNKEQTVSAVVDGYDFYYAVMILCLMDSDATFDIYFDQDAERVVLIGNKTLSVKVPSGFDQTTMSITYEYKDVPFILTLPTLTADYPNVVNENWMFLYSSSTSLKEIIQFTKESEDISKIKIPTDFINQKNIIDKTQLFKIETVEDKINSSKLKGSELLDKVVEYVDEYIQTYAVRKKIEEKDENDNVVEVWETYEADTNNARFNINGKTNYDYVWKVNEKFWRYNRHISVRDLVAYFIAKGDKYEYRLLSYRILGVDCYLFKEKLTEQLLIEGLLCVEDFAINVQDKSIEKPLVLSYKYEYATGNYYKKRAKLRRTSQDKLDYMSTYPMVESIMLYYGEDLGENIIQNQISFLESDLVRPKEMIFDTKDDRRRLYSHPLDPIFLTEDNQFLKKKNSFGKGLVLKEFNSYLSSANIQNTQVTRSELMYGYVLRLPESVTIPLEFINQFNCFKISILPKESDLNNKGVDVFAVFGLYDLKNASPLFIGDSANSISCKEYIANKPYGGTISIRRKPTKASGASDDGTYAFSKSLKYLTDNSYDNLFEGKFITDIERDTKKIPKEKKKAIVSEILIAYNTKQPKVIKEGDYQFNKFMIDRVDEIDVLKMQQIWNETYNYIMYPKKEVKVNYGDGTILKLDNSKFPIFIEHSRFFKEETTNEFLLNNNQIDGIKFHVGNYNSSLLAHEVGFGKTTTAICSLSHNFLTGQAKRTMISVPNPTYVNWIAESKGQLLPDGKISRGLIPHVNIVELKNARKDVFLQYDKKTFTQTDGVKKYTKNQIENIHNFQDVTSTIIKELTRVGDLYFADYAPEGKKENYSDLIKFIEKVFDKNLVEWRLEDFFNEYSSNIIDEKDKYEDKFKDELSKIQSDENDIVDKIYTNNKGLSSIEVNEEVKKTKEKYSDKKVKLLDKLVREFTNEILSIIKSKSQSIFDRIGVYQECFLQKNSLIISTHEAIGQLRVKRDVAFAVAEELKDNFVFGTDLLKNPIGFDKLEIDSIIVDEIHNFNELFAYSKRQISQLMAIRKMKGRGTHKLDFIRSDYENFNYLSNISGLRYAKKARGTNMSSVIKFNLSASSTSSKKATLFGICKTLQNNFREKRALNIMLLSATPFVDDLFQMIGVFNMIRPFQMPINFFSNYLYQDWDWENDHKGETVLKVQTSDFKNDEARNNWIKLFSQFYTFDARINANRPNKFTYPFDCKSNSNQYEDNCNSNVYLNFSEEQYKIYKNIGQFVDGTLGKESIVKSVPNTVKVSTDIYIDPVLLEDVKKYIDSSNDMYAPELAVVEFIENDWMDVVNDKKHPNNKEITDIYLLLKDEIDAELGEDDEDDEAEGKADEDGETKVADTNDKSQYSGVGTSDSGTRALQGQDYGKKLALSPYMVTPQGAKKGEINPDLPPLYGMNTPENITKSAINFVETSPKIYFTVKSIECLIKKHIENKEDISGQIIYMAWGQGFWYGGVKYNGMELIKAYLKNSLDLNNKFTIEVSESSGSAVKVKCGDVENLTGEKIEAKTKKYVLEEVQILSGKSPDALRKKAISDSFNDGRIKVLIGSGTIKEGINLQGQKNSKIVHGNSTIYVLTAEYAPMAMMQLEGRIWRQGNPLENVRIVYPLIKNSIDNHIYSKLNEKIKKVKNMLEAGIYDFKETQFEKDIEGVSMSLNTNIQEKIKIKWSAEERKIGELIKRISNIKDRIVKVKDRYTEANSSAIELVTVYNAVSKSIEDYYLGKYIRETYKSLSEKIKEEIKSKKIALQDRLSKVYEKDLLEWQKLRDANEKINEENEKKNKANEKLIKDKKATKIENVEFTIGKPLKKDDKYQPDYTEIDLDEEQMLRDAKDKAVEVNTKKLNDNLFTNDEIPYIHKQINISMPYNDISSSVGKLLSVISILQVTPIDSDEMRVVNSSITVSGYYWALEGKSEYIDYAFAKVLNDNSSTSPTLSQKMAKSIKDNNVKNESGSVFLFKDFCKLFTNGGAYENVMSDYQSLVKPKFDISNIDSLIISLNTEISNYNTQLTEKDKFDTKWKAIFEAEEEKIRKERESLTNMKQFVLLDVNKFCETNKFVYMKDTLTKEEEQEMFKIKK